VDTQYLFFHPSKNRRLSLRYLAWAVFKEYIQEEPIASSTAVTTTENSTEGMTTMTTTTTTNFEGHDSIEDARMALRLWKKFQEYSDAGIINQMLEEIFREGVKLGFRPPPRHQTSTVTTISASSSATPLTTSPNNPSSVPVGSTAAVPAAAGPRLGPSAISSGRNTPDFGASLAAAAGGVATAAGPTGNPNTSGSMNGSSAPSTPRQIFRRSAALTPSNGTFSGNNVKNPTFGAGSPLR
jgi:PAB-dependent poly(A)-specific ribonuclease subunit 2